MDKIDILFLAIISQRLVDAKIKCKKHMLLRIKAMSRLESVCTISVFLHVFAFVLFFVFGI